MDVFVESGPMNEELPHREPDNQAAHPRTHRTLFFDVVVTSPLLTRLLQRTARQTGYAANIAAQREIHKYRATVPDPEDFIPLAIETYG